MSSATVIVPVIVPPIRSGNPGIAATLFPATLPAMPVPETVMMDPPLTLAPSITLRLLFVPVTPPAVPFGAVMVAAVTVALVIRLLLIAAMPPALKVRSPKVYT